MPNSAGVGETLFGTLVYKTTCSFSYVALPAVSGIIDHKSSTRQHRPSIG